METVKIEVKQLRQLISDRLKENSISQQHADIVADVLAFADKRGVKSHGIMRLQHYIQRIQQGGINKDADITVEAVNDVIAKVDGDNALGHVVAKVAMDEAISISKNKGIGVAVASNSSHSGALGFYADQAAREGVVGMTFAQADALVAPYGAKSAFLGANPIAVGIPHDDRPIVLDMSTSNVAFGKVMIEKERGNKIPLDWGLDENGIPTDDPAEVKALLPMGGAKGYGLAIVVDVLSGILAGADFGKHIRPMYGDLSEKRGLGQFFLAINPEFFIGKEFFLERMKQFVDELHACEPAPGHSKVYVPGERSFENEMRSNEEGVEIEKDMYDFLRGK
ncbi:ureidoglycolate dehydrogenase [Sporosarcina aquimarina]|uniref:ureidoglycolate dehydrogenase n=1 Tax=Sporosarcina aquimarina TaxID=114975 RepID=UPI001C8D7548|nr:ureidoglycolate dehydrogenase [Sporosarcina aquimarina]MBY0223175.1 ureidoglycolate dehydrogenase [Sporosarcina aquimarina]